MTIVSNTAPQRHAVDPLLWRDRFIASLLVSALWLLVLFQHAAPSVTFHDSGEFAMAMASDGLPHQPGAPTWCVLASLFHHLGGFADPGRAANCFSATCGAIALGLLFFWVHDLCCRLGWRSRIAAFGGALAATLLLARTPAFLEQSFMAEQYTLALCFFFALAILAQHQETTTTPGLAFVFMGILWGVAFGNHFSQLVLCAIPGIVLLAKLRAHGLAWVIRQGCLLAAGFACGLSVFLWLPFRSHAKPLLDECHADTWSGFLRTLGRGQWTTHPLSEAPRGFLGEWVASYDFWTQLGPLGLFLAASGLFLLARRMKPSIGGTMLYVVTYAAGMLLGHMRQDLITVDYIRQYGVMDWHLPLYALGAVAGGCSLAWVMTKVSNVPRPAAAAIFLTVVLGLLLADATRAVMTQSLRNYDGARHFVSGLLTPLPPKSVLLLSSDNVALMTTYEAWITQRGTNHWAVIDSERILRTLERASTTGGWDLLQRTKYLTETLAVPGLLSLNVPPLTAQDAAERRVFAEYSARHPDAAEWLRPAGLLFEVCAGRVSNEDAGRAYRQDKADHPELFLAPSHPVHRLEREAWALLHEMRGGYFFARQMWLEAAESYELCVQWSGNTGSSWFCLATALENAGRGTEAETALIRAIEVEPLLEGPRVNLAIMQARKGDLATAQTLLEEEVRLHPASKSARDNLSVVQRQRANRSTR